MVKSVSKSRVYTSIFTIPGCDGGFEFLVGGKYAEEHGMVEEKCKPYQAMDRECEREERDKCKKYYFTGYEHVGGYFGV